MLTRLGRELSQTEGAHYEGGPAVLVPCQCYYYSLQCRSDREGDPIFPHGRGCGGLLRASELTLVSPAF